MYLSHIYFNVKKIIIPFSWKIKAIQKWSWCEGVGNRK